MQRSIVIKKVNYLDPTDRLALLIVLDMYARDPMGGGEALPADVLAALPSRLRQLDNYHGALAWYDGRAVGLINCFTGFSTFKARPLLNVHDIVTHAGCRGQGIGAALLEWAAVRARELGCCKLTLEVLSNNHVARRCYQRAGFAPYVLDPAAGTAELMQRYLD